MGQICLYQNATGADFISTSVFQFKMNKIFHSSDDIFVYIDNILLFTKALFEHHLQHLNEVLKIIKANNMRIHSGQSFLANSQVNYLGYTITTKGIKPQITKL